MFSCRAQETCCFEMATWVASNRSVVGQTLDRASLCPFRIDESIIPNRDWTDLTPRDETSASINTAESVREDLLYSKEFAIETRWRFSRRGSPLASSRLDRKISVSHGATGYSKLFLRTFQVKEIGETFALRHSNRFIRFLFHTSRCRVLFLVI